MDVIDLCEEDDEFSIQSTSALPKQSKIKTKGEVSGPPKVPPIRVVNLASLQKTPRVVCVEPPADPQKSRRKTIHNPKANADAAIEIIHPNTKLPQKIRISCGPLINGLPTASSASTNQPEPSTSTKPIFIKSLKQRTSYVRRNYELMRRVAFLRVCAEYMLRNLDMHEIKLGETQSLKLIMEQYNAAKKVRN